jgi:hypothetical protein
LARESHYRIFVLDRPHGPAQEADPRLGGIILTFCRETVLASPASRQVHGTDIRSRGPTDWRFHAVLVASECGRSAWVDHDTLRMLDLYQHQGQRAVDDDAMSSRLEPYRDALALHQGPDEPVRAVLEAHLLARRSIDDVAKAMSLPPEVVRVYESVFFNVTAQNGRNCCCDSCEGFFFIPLGCLSGAKKQAEQCPGCDSRYLVHVERDGNNEMQMWLEKIE